MTSYMTPFTHLVGSDGRIANAQTKQMRHLRDMRGFYADAAAEAELATSDPLIYEVNYAYVPKEVPGELGICTTIIHPGKVGDEYFMTKGHFHGKIDRAELYFGLSGSGMLVMETPDGQTNAQPMIAGTSAYVPPHWAHRTVNVGSEPFVFLACFPSDAGYDYGTIAERGFGIIIVERDGAAAVVSNPRR
jgi:glucose-6-phosphate isomerase, archaeal